MVDPRHAQQVFILDLKINRLDCISEPGSGPGEYRMPASFVRVKDHYYISSRGTRKLNVYDSSFEFKYSAPLPGYIIGSQLVVGGTDRLYITSLSRYSPEASIIEFDSMGNILNTFSPLDNDFINIFDTFNPQGGLIFNKNLLYQYFNHNYSIFVWSLDGELVEKIDLSSQRYIAPDFKKAKNLDGLDEPKKFMRSFTMLTGFFCFQNGYITVLTKVRRGGPEHLLEFWDHDFYGAGYFKVPSEEKFLGVFKEKLIFSKEGENNIELIWREVQPLQVLTK